MLSNIFALLAAYLLGSVPFAMVTSKLFGLQDPRSYGSGNPGATNVLRSGHKFAAVLTLLGDAAKGWLAVWLAGHYDLLSPMMAGIALAVFLGHLYPIFLGFKGGKGVATALGVMLAFEPLLALGIIAVWLFVVALSKYSSLGAICAAVLAPVIYTIGNGLFWRAPSSFSVALGIIGALLLYRHRANIQRLLNGTEPRIGKKAAQTEQQAST